VAEELAFQLERPQKLIADRFLVNFLYVPSLHPLFFSQVALARKRFFLDEKERDGVVCDLPSGRQDGTGGLGAT
jgi:hypothetical protein